MLLQYNLGLERWEIEIDMNAYKPLSEDWCQECILEKNNDNEFKLIEKPVENSAFYDADHKHIYNITGSNLEW